MKMGMSRVEARSRLRNNEFTWEDIRQMMLVTHPALAGENGRAPSRVNEGMSLVTAFNIHWRCVRDRTGPILPNDHLGVSNALRDFGFSNNPKRKAKAEVKVHQEDLIEINEVIHINSFEEYVRAFGHTKMSKTTWELQNNPATPLVLVKEE